MSAATKADRWRTPERWLYALSSGDGDEWGNVMSHLFGIAEAVYAFNGEVLEEFRPGLHVREIPEDWPDSEYYVDIASGEIDVEKLHAFYRVLLRYAEVLNRAGLSY